MKPTQERINKLNLGVTQSNNLMETLAVDFTTLLSHVLPSFIMPPLPEKLGIVKRMDTVGKELHDQYGLSIVKQLKQHQSDTLRNLACYLIKYEQVSLHKKLNLIKPLANDQHFGVREWAWMALRTDIINNLDDALAYLEKWTYDPSENIRRFATEATRPRGVWCAHITAMRKEPWRGQDLLEPLKNDPAKYVQLSLGNWLNDASKDHPEWVREICNKWQQQSPTDITRKVCKRGLRTLNKK